MRREICRRISAMTQLSAELSSRERPGSVADRKTEMCSIFDVYDKCVRKGVSVRSHGERCTEEGKQVRLDTVCGGLHSGLLLHNISHCRAVWS